MFVIGHLRGTSRREVFPIGERSADREGVAKRKAIIKYDIQQNVRVRKHEVDVEGLKHLLRSSRKKTIKQVASEINRPLTEVEHWFRTDNCFSIPNEKIWFDLKRVLGIHTSDFDAQVTEFIVKENEYESSNRVYDAQGVAPTITATNADKKVLIRNGSDTIIRKLTPRECWRLQGFPDAAYDKASALNTENQLYKQAGNSVTVNVISAIAKRL